MAKVSCNGVLRWLSAYLDDELSVGQRIRVDAHLTRCVGCARDEREARELSQTLRRHVTPAVAEETTERLRAASGIVLSRVAAERELARTSGLARLSGDLHLAWVAGATGVVALLCAVTVGVVGAASVRSPDSLAAVMVALANPGSNENPLRLRTGMAAPQLSPDAMLVTLPDPMPLPGLSSGVTLAVVLTREGRVAGLEVLRSRGVDPSVWEEMVDSASTARFVPAEYWGAPVAVNMVWVVEQMTVSGDPGDDPPTIPAA